MQPIIYQGIMERYKKELLENVVPFWTKHAPDFEYGGYFHCFDRDGTIIDTNKSMWIEARAIWMFSRLFNSSILTNQPERTEWLNLAKLGADFLKKYGRDENGDFYFRLSKEGKPLVAPYNIFSDCFAAIGFLEYAKASGDQESFDIAKQTYQRIQNRKNQPKGKWDKTMSGTQPLFGLSLPMMNINVSDVFQTIEPNPVYEEIIRAEISVILDRFVDRKYHVIRENIVQTGGFCNETYEGRHINPGHGIESLWFIMSVASRRKDSNIIKRCHEALLDNLEFGWDTECGGLFYFMDVLGKPHLELSWDMKLWWVHLESLIATLMGFQLTGDSKLWDWFVKLEEYTWKHFPDSQYGEWFPYLTRDGKVNNNQKGGRWKCFFHLPRALLMIAEMSSVGNNPTLTNLHYL